jgi:hypothetical protein
MTLINGCWGYPIGCLEAHLDVGFGGESALSFLQRRHGCRTACKRRNSPPLQVEGHLDAIHCLLAQGVGWKEKKRGKERKKRMRKKEIGEKEKNGLSNFLEIVIDNLYLLYYYRVIKIEDVNYIIK